MSMPSMWPRRSQLSATASAGLSSAFRRSPPSQNSWQQEAGSAIAWWATRHQAPDGVPRLARLCAPS